MQNSLQTLRSYRVTWLQTNLCYNLCYLCYNLWLQTSLCYSNARCIPGWRHVGLFPTICPTTKNRNSIRFFATYREIPDVTKSLHSAGWTDAPKVSKEKMMSFILLRAFYSLQSFQMPLWHFILVSFSAPCYVFILTEAMSYSFKLHKQQLWFKLRSTSLFDQNILLVGFTGRKDSKDLFTYCDYSLFQTLPNHLLLVTNGPMIATRWSNPWWWRDRSKPKY